MTSFEEKLDVRFHNQALLRQAMTHKSFHNENPAESSGHNERLEFLGDAVLDLILSEYFFVKFPDLDEGKMSKLRASLVNEKVLAETFLKMGFSEAIRFGRGENLTGGALKPRLLACAFEALIGALYIDQGYLAAQKLVEKLFAERLQNLPLEDQFGEDFKTQLQELSQQKFKKTPTYELVSADGPDHEKVFKVGVTIDGQKFSYGEGRSKKQAEQMAASVAIKELL